MSAFSNSNFFMGMDFNLGTGTDPYKVLGVARGATPEEIRKAYEARLHEVHPDKGGTAEAFQRVKQAYDAIKKQKPGAGAPPFFNDPEQDPVWQVFRGAFSGSAFEKAYSGDVEIGIRLEDVLTGTTVDLRDGDSVVVPIGVVQGHLTSRRGKVVKVRLGSAIHARRRI